ncbi:hypothetical protein RRG08_059301 [Elysia crispata]|uniref:Uncharacterized protein n=1 Tax=Elysia crispata TaxID=231223 RepID=A0AAE1DEH8_9GAST|nr:hypothetical protein RRG08_059301 [Elysia crispata]
MGMLPRHRHHHLNIQNLLIGFWQSDGLVASQELSNHCPEFLSYTKQSLTATLSKIVPVSILVKKQFVTIELCEVADNPPWPKGSFCTNRILFKSCPDGSSSGYVPFDTENTVRSGYARNNVAPSVLNPFLYFSCQRTRPAETPVELLTK